MKRRDFLKSAGVAAATGALVGASSRVPGPRPNILFILVDELRFPSVFPTGVNNVGEFLQRFMPNVHSLWTRGVKFGRHYTAASACTPSRGVLITGLYSQQSWLMLTLTNDPGQRAAHATAQPGLPDLWEASPQGRLSDPLYRKMACLLRPRGGAGTVWIRRAHLPGPGRLQSAGHRRTGARLPERPGHCEPGRPVAERPLAGRGTLVRHSQLREPARSGVLLGRHRVPDLQQSVPGGTTGAGQGILDPGRSAAGLLG